MARNRESASESEAKTTTSRASAKAKNSSVQQAQQDYIAKHVTSNGPYDGPKINPLDFENLPVESLIKYNRKFNLNSENPYTINGYMLKSEIGKKTISYKKNSKKNSSKELAATVKKHFQNLPCRENEVITNFLYKVKNQDKDFKLSFK
ncbi:transcriptional regulatory protein Sap30p [[Candida] railenensis]|uniref:Transcriptional regulatory protein Sap30p n=1 Tax=[Candida] railenensis TaxID=45579 RepID=A0A9P0QTJ9_9ASCO|nr:transcriptional regulatory protein Sap30p [[Candida] railenensis]